MDSNIFYRLPKVLFKDEKFCDISLEAKLLYCLLLDRTYLSEQNGWKDDDGQTYIYFTVEEAMEMLGIGPSKSVRMFKELEKDGLIRRKRQGQGKPVMIFVSDLSKQKVKTYQNRKSRLIKTESLDFLKSKSNNTDINNTDYIENDLINFNCGGGEAGAKKEVIIESLKNQLDYDVLAESCDKTLLITIIEIMADVMTSDKEYYSISKAQVKAEEVKQRFSSLNASHIEYVMDFIGEQKNIKSYSSYIISLLYNSPREFMLYYDERVRREVAEY